MIDIRDYRDTLNSEHYSSVFSLHCADKGKCWSGRALNEIEWSAFSLRRAARVSMVPLSVVWLQRVHWLAHTMNDNYALYLMKKKKQDNSDRFEANDGKTKAAQKNISPTTKTIKSSFISPHIFSSIWCLKHRHRTHTHNDEDKSSLDLIFFYHHYHEFPFIMFATVLCLMWHSLVCFVWILCTLSSSNDWKLNNFHLISQLLAGFLLLSSPCVSSCLHHVLSIISLWSSFVGL